MISFKRCNICNHRCIDSRVQQRHPQREFVANVFQPCRDQRAAPVLSGLYAREIFYFSLYVLNESRNARLSALTTSRSARKVVCNATFLRFWKKEKKKKKEKVVRLIYPFLNYWPRRRPDSTLHDSIFLYFLYPWQYPFLRVHLEIYKLRETI